MFGQARFYGQACPTGQPRKKQIIVACSLDSHTVSDKVGSFIDLLYNVIDMQSLAVLTDYLAW